MTRRDRFKVKAPVLIFPPGDRPPVNALTVDMTETGLGIMTHQPLWSGDQMLIHLMLAESHHPLHILVKVIWCEKAIEQPDYSHRAGFQVRAISVSDAITLKNFIAEHRQMPFTRLSDTHF